MSDTAAIFEGPANCLMELDNLRGAVRDIPNPASAATALVGNWVGGRFRLTEDTLDFALNALNKPFQRDTAPLTIPLSEVTALSTGKVMLFFYTVDVRCGPTLYRFRLPESQAVLAELRRLCPTAARG